MQYYIYKIENKINHKIYIGLTNNTIRRRCRHFGDLRRGTHDNHFLQKEYNIYGFENFDFTIEFSNVLKSFIVPYNGRRGEAHGVRPEADEKESGSGL